MKHPLLLGLALLSLTPTLYAATPFEDDLIPQELARALTGNEFLRSLPDNFPLADIKLNVDLQLLGTAQRGGMNAYVYLRSTTDAQAMATALAPALVGAGWTIMTTSGNVSHRVASLCHPTRGDLQVTVQAEPEGGSRLTLLVPHSVQQITQNCAERKLAADQAAAFTAFMNEQIPTLRWPSNEVFPGQFTSGPRIVSFNSAYYENERSGASLIQNSSTSEVYRHFAAQMQAAGWRQDAGVVNAEAASGTWMKAVTPPSGTAPVDLLTSLHVLKHGSTHYEVKVALQPYPSPLCLPTESITPCVAPPPFRALPPELGIRGIPAGFSGSIDRE